jgi:hypothetical protein
MRQDHITRLGNLQSERTLTVSVKNILSLENKKEEEGKISIFLFVEKSFYERALSILR